jgi:hypothetical protein
MAVPNPSKGFVPPRRRSDPNLYAQDAVINARLENQVESGVDPNSLDLEKAFEPMRENLAAMHREAKANSPTPIHSTDPHTGYIPMYPVHAPVGNATVPETPNPADDLVIGRTTIDEAYRHRMGPELWKRMHDRLLERNDPEVKGTGGGRFINIPKGGLEASFHRPIHVINSPGNQLQMGNRYGFFQPGADLTVWQGKQWGTNTPKHELLMHGLLDSRPRHNYDLTDTWENAFLGPNGGGFNHHPALEKTGKWADKHGHDVFEFGPFREVVPKEGLKEMDNDIFRYVSTFQEFRNELLDTFIDERLKQGVDTSTMDETEAVLKKMIGRGPIPFDRPEPVYREGPNTGQPIPEYNNRQRALHFLLRGLMDDPSTKGKLIEMINHSSQVDQPGAVYG